MAMRKLTKLKIFSLLLFIFELLAPTYLAAISPSTESEDYKIVSHSGVFSFSTFLSEEAGNEEEREGRDNHKIGVEIVSPGFNFLPSLPQTKDASHQFILSHHLPQDKHSLIILYGTFRI